MSQTPRSSVHQRLAAALFQTLEGAISGAIDAGDVALQNIPVIGWAASMTGGVGAYLNNKVEALVLKLGIFGKDPRRTRLVITGGRLSLLPMVGPYLGGAEDLVTLVRAWIYVVAPNVVLDTLDPALNSVMDRLQTLKLSPAPFTGAMPHPPSADASADVLGRNQGQTMNVTYTVVPPSNPSR